MGFKDLPGAKLAKPSQTTSDKSASQSAASSSLSKDQSLSSTKSSQ